MPNPWSLEAILKRGPHAADDPLNMSNVRSSAVGAVSAGDQLIFIPTPTLGCWVTIISDTDCYYHLGQGTGSLDRTASATNSYFLPAGVEREWWCIGGYQDRIVTVQKTIPGRIYRFPSNH